MRLAGASVLLVVIAGCSSNGSRGSDAGTPSGDRAPDDGPEMDAYGYDVALDHVSPTCPVSFSLGSPGAPPPDSGGNPKPPPFTCQPLPSQCANNPTCDCVACYSGCNACISLGNGQYSDGGGGGATCSYGSDSFVVECINA